METWITSIMADFGYIGIFVLIMVENLFPPIPSEIILTFGGFMTTVTSLNVVMVIIVATLGSVVGAILLYKVASYFGKERLTKIVLKYGRILRLKESDIERAESFFLKYGSWAVFLCRMIPLIRSLISIPAGMTKMKMSRFLILTTAGSLLWNTVLIGLGAVLGESWNEIVVFMDSFSTIIYSVIAILVVVGLGFFFRARFKKTLDEE
ncbi:DedA family protein [Listeria monocytogenes]|uniref:Alkaline phosphatase n=2 Tax=Listeria monocytogenes TaxID=1639 RepID=A0A2Z5BXB5_LISMN|nr:DedA family protein [Listeria monocytogenes]EAD5050569.1 DedA family protein [Listeria monocytogenes serotype 4b]EAE1680698.1 DedA family protein [Listeria monocytogenes LIS0071]EAE3706172.1 DedA family protein [Listeria monocytogenes serotype 1/2b]EAF3078092.1 DedA family protein [Listeria monocytogenes serotype 1/2a]EAG6252701.1 DedA family protein [Listeria monocytogenes CFSAN003806]EAG6262074.1 DedA family protein [Listeria monocytogenes CFSAN003725]EAG6332058.1 DedA family protein [L